MKKCELNRGSLKSCKGLRNWWFESLRFFWPSKSEKRTKKSQVSRRKRNLKRREKCKRRKESRPEQSPSPLYPESLNLPSRLSHASSAELWSTLYKSEPSSNLWWKCVRIWRRESERFGTGKQCYFFRSQSFILFPHCLTSYSNCVKVLWGYRLINMLLLLYQVWKSIEQHYLREEHEDKQHNKNPPWKYKWHLKLLG